MDIVDMMQKVDNELWDVVEKNIFEQDDMSRVAAVMLKVAIQIYKMTYDEDAVKSVLKHAFDSVDDVRVPGPPRDTVVH